MVTRPHNSIVHSVNRTQSSSSSRYESDQRRLGTEHHGTRPGENSRKCPRTLRKSPRLKYVREKSGKGKGKVREFFKKSGKIFDTVKVS